MKYRKLRIAWSVAWGVVAVLLIALWVRSYKTFDRASGEIVGTPVILVSYAGRLTAVTTDDRFRLKNRRTLLVWSFPNLESGPILPKNWTLADLSGGGVDWGDTDVVWPYRGVAGFGWIYRTMYINVPNPRSGWSPTGLSGRSYATDCTGLMVPNWFVVLIAASFSGIPWLRLRFSLRTLLIAMTVAAIGLGWIVYAIRK